MIRSKKPLIINERSQKMAIVHVEVTPFGDDLENDIAKYLVKDYIVDDSSKQYINEKTIGIPFAQKDQLKQLIVAQTGITGTESEVNKAILPYVLLYFVTSDFLPETEVLIYGTKPEDWEITPINE